MSAASSLTASQRVALCMAADAPDVVTSNRNRGTRFVHSGSALALERCGLLRHVRFGSDQTFRITDRGREVVAELRGEPPPAWVADPLERHRSERPADPPAPLGPWPDSIAHGSPEGYDLHLQRGEFSCGPCRDASSVRYWVKDPQRRREALAFALERAEREKAPA